MDNFCSHAHCRERCVPKKYAVPLAYTASALALAVPIINSFGANVKTTLALTSYDFSFLTLILVAVWMISGFISGMERHQNYALCVIHSLGIPGVVLALLTVSQA